MSAQIRVVEPSAPAPASQSLAALEPKETDARLAAALPAPIKACLQKTHHPGYEFKGFEIERLPSAQHLAAIREAIERHRFAMRPAPHDQLLPGLARLRVMTKARIDDDEEGTLRAAAYIEELQRWPADVALHVLVTQPRLDKWWPAWAELEERLELYARMRVKRLEALVELSQRMMIRDALEASDRPMSVSEIEESVGTTGLSVVLLKMRYHRGIWQEAGNLREVGVKRYEWVAS
ncbi:MAG: hypothetical protein RIC87_18170 [Kiloniellales bacterium]